MALGSSRIVRYIITGDSTGAVKAMKETEVAASKVGSKLEETGSKLKTLGSGMTSFGHKLSALSLPLLAVGGYSIKAAMDFQTSMTQLRTQAGASAKELKYLEAGALKIGPKVAEGPNELAQALYPIRSVGLQGKQALEALTAAAKGSQVSGAGLTETSEALSGALRTQLSDVKSASGAMSIMNGIVGLGRMHLDELNAAMTTGILPTAKNLGLGFRDVGAALDAMTRQGIPAQAEATRLRTNLTKFSAPTGAALKALRSIGLEQYSLANDLRKPNGLVTALRDLQQHLDRVGKNEQGLALSKAFGGTKGSANVVGLLNALPEMERIRGQLNKYGERQLNSAFTTRQADASFKLAQALDAGKAALVSFGQTLIPIVIPALVKFSKLVIGGIEWLKRMPKPLKDVMVGFTLLLAVGGPLLIFFGNMISAMGSVIGVAGKLATALSTRLGSAVESSVAGSAEASGAETAAFAGLGTALGGAFVLAFAGVAAYGVVKALQQVQELFHHGAGKQHTLREVTATIAGGHVKGMRVEHGLLKPGVKGEHGLGITEIGAGPGSHQLRAAVLSKRKTEEEARERWWKKNIHQVEYEGHTYATTNGQIRTPSGQVIELHLHLDGKPIAHSVAAHARNDATIAKPLAETVAKYAQNRAARE
jgi:TP901 family phage tail tape measure protein